MSQKQTFKKVPIYLQLKYVSMLSSKLTGFKWVKKDKEVCFRCPLCGDSQSNKKKRSAYFYINPDGVSFHCFKCGISQSLYTFLKNSYSDLFLQYKTDFITENGFGYRWEEKKQQAKEPIVKRMTMVFSKTPLQKLKKISDLGENHFAKIYVESRKIPKSVWSDLYFTENYKKWIHENVNKESFVSLTEEQMNYPDQRLVIPFLNMSKTPYAYQGRYLGTSEKATRYITVKDERFTDDLPLIYGLEKIDKTKPIFVLEGPIDSMFVPNAIAVAGSGLNKILSKKTSLDFIFCYDNQPRSKTLVKLYDKIIKSGHKIIIWDKSILSKDINEMITSGELEEKTLVDRLMEMSYNGFTAELKFSEWKKI